MRFYTNVVQWGNQILVREYKNGERLNHKVKYSPTLYVPVQKETGWKTLDGKNVMPYKHDTIKGAKEFIQQYQNQPHLGLWTRQVCIHLFVRHIPRPY